MMKKLLPFAMATALTFTAACGGGDKDDPSGPSGEALTTAQFEALYEAYTVIGSLGLGVIGFQPETNTLAAQRLAAQRLAAQTGESYDETVNCPNGGTTRVNGTFSISQSGSITSTATQSYAECKARSSSGTVWTFNGNPNIALSITSTINQSTGAYSFTGTQTGGVSYSGAGKGGNCQVNINMSGSVNPQTGSYTMNITGTACGQNVNESYTY